MQHGAASGPEGRLDVDSVREYTRLNYVPAPATIFRDVHKVRPAEFIVIDEDGEVVDQRIYWSPSSDLETELRVTGSTGETLGHLERRFTSDPLENVVDVPIGAFLSGGIDLLVWPSCRRTVRGPSGPSPLAPIRWRRTRPNTQNG